MSSSQILSPDSEDIAEDLSIPTLSSDCDLKPDSSKLIDLE